MEKKVFLKMFFVFSVIMPISLLIGCASTPLAIKPLKEGFDTRSYKNVVVAECKAAEGVMVPSDKANRLREKIAFFLSSKYSHQFSRISNDPSDLSDDYLLIKVEITEYNEGSKMARFMLAGLGRIHLDVNVMLFDGKTGDKVGEGKNKETFGAGGIYGASIGIDDIIDKTAEAIAEAIGENKLQK